MWVWSTRQNTRTIRFSSVKDGGRLYSKTLLLPLQCRTLVLMRVMRKVSVTLKSVSNASVTRKILPQGPSAWTKKRSFKKKGLKIPFPRLSQNSILWFIFFFTSIFGSHEVCIKPEWNRQVQSSYRSSTDLQVPLPRTSHYTAVPASFQKKKCQP